MTWLILYWLKNVGSFAAAALPINTFGSTSEKSDIHLLYAAGIIPILSPWSIEDPRDGRRLTISCGPGHLSRGVPLYYQSVWSQERDEKWKCMIKSKVFLFIIQSTEFKVYSITCLSVVATNRPFKWVNRENNDVDYDIDDDSSTTLVALANKNE